jgi:hypothetical protein
VRKGERERERNGERVLNICGLGEENEMICVKEKRGVVFILSERERRRVREKTWERERSKSIL